MKFRFFWCISFLCVATFSFARAQDENRGTLVTFCMANGDTSFVECVDSSHVVFLSLNDFLESLHLPGIVNDTTGKIECLINNQLVRFTERNPFVVITDRKTSTATVYQMPWMPFRRHGSFFIPTIVILQIYKQIADQDLTFDARRMALLQGSTAAFKNDITGIQIEKKLNGTLITILARKKLGDVESWLKPDGWLFVTITGVTADTEALDATQPFAAVKNVLAFQSATSIQLTFRVAPDVVQAETSVDPASNNLLISLRTRSDAEKKEMVKKQEETKKTLEQGRDRWKLDVIVIDAGHGGKDPGALGVSGTREKDVTLDVALKLGRLIQRNLKDVKLVYTRTEDDFVELYRRTQIANEAGGKLFISIHCNSMAHKPSRANGFEIYLLRPNRTEEAVEIASRENAVVKLEEGYEQRYRKLTEEEFIIVTMAQSAYVKHSEQFAECAAESMSKNPQIKNSGVKQAGFYVLVGASMPNVLVEIGYLSNRKEEKILRSDDGQRRIAEALYRGVKEYKARYEESLHEGMENDIGSR